MSPLRFPHAQLGLNALATAMIMRVCYRMPLRQITDYFLQLQQLKISPGGIVKQIKRTAKWMKSQEHRLTLLIRAAGVVYADETKLENQREKRLSVDDQHRSAHAVSH